MIPGWGGFPGEGHGNPLQLFLPRESHGQRSLEATVHSHKKKLQRVGHYRSDLACTYACMQRHRDKNVSKLCEAARSHLSEPKKDVWGFIWAVLI